MKNFYTIFFLLLFPFFSNAQTPGEFILRSVLIDPPGENNGYQYAEIAGPSSMPLSNIWFIEIDGKAGSTGKIDLAVNLSAYSTGTNGLLLIRDASNVLVPAPDAPTQVVVHDFNPDLSSESATFALVTNFTGAVGDDVDDNDDGVLNTNLPWGFVISAVGISNGSAGNIIYGSALSLYFGVNIPAYGTEGYDGFAQFNNQYYGYTLDPDSQTGGVYIIDSAWDSYGRENIYIENGKTLSPGRTDAALPVNLLSFNLSYVNANAVLHWVSAGNDLVKFFVEESIDGINFKTINAVNARNGMQQYSFINYATPKSGNVFYRLRMIDKEGKITYSSVLKLNLSESVALSAYPNPAINNLIIKHQKTTNGAALKIFTTDGKLMQMIMLNENSTQTSVDISNFIEGIYFVQFINANTKQSFSFTKN